MSNLPVPWTPGPTGNQNAHNHGPVSKTRLSKARKPRKCEITLFNTERVPAQHTELVLRHVFGKSAEESWNNGYFDRRIVLGPYSREAAETKMRQVRDYAAEHHLIAPVMQRRFAKDFL